MEFKAVDKQTLKPISLAPPNKNIYKQSVLDVMDAIVYAFTFGQSGKLEGSKMHADEHADKTIEDMEKEKSVELAMQAFGINKERATKLIETGQRLGNPVLIEEVGTDQSDDPITPGHYHAGGIDLWTFARANFTREQLEGYHRISAMKYIMRAGKKAGNSFEQDIKKAANHLDELVDILESADEE